MKYTQETKVQMMKWRKDHPEQYAEIKKRADKKYYEANKEQLNRKRTEQMRAKRIKLKEEQEQEKLNELPEITI
jgi:hypothetical protein